MLPILLLLTFSLLSAFNVNITRVSAVKSPYIAVVPDTTLDLTPGMNFTVSIYTDYVGTNEYMDYIHLYQFALSYNPSVLKGVEVVNGDLIVGGSFRFIAGPFDNVAGELSLTVGYYDEPGEVTKGPGTLANVTFTVVDYGASNIAIDSHTKLKGWNWFVEPHDYDIINAAEQPDQIQDGFFCNIPPIHDVAVSLVAPEEAVVGQLVTINVTVANMGTYHENVTLTVSYDDTPINTTTFTLTLTKKGLNETFSFSWNTTGLAPTMYTINATANIPLDDLPADNTKTKQITLKLAHDVAVSLVAPEEAVVGQLVTINVTVANMGTYHENVTLTVSYDDTPINTTVIDMLPPGESEIIEFSWDTSTGVAEDNYTITAEANILLDDLPVNNNETRLITLTLVRDVSVVNITTAPDMPIVRQLVTINVTVENHGGYSEDFKVEFTCKVTTRRDAEIVYTSESQPSVTPPMGDSTTLSFNWNTTGINPGLYKIRAEAILAEDVDQENNVDWKSINVISSLGTIWGIVTDSSTGDPISGANVTADTVASDTTNEDGYYWITDVEPGNYTVTASAAGYQTSSETTTVLPGETTPLNFELTLLPGTITGTVTNSLTGEPIAGANVTANGYSATTNSSGAYVIPDVPLGNYTVTASAAKYVNQSKTATVTAGTTTTLDFELTPLNGTISGIVTDSSTGDPISEATVTANGMSATTNSSGAYTISDVPAGNYTVTVSANGYEDSSQTSVTVVAGETTTVNFELTPAQPLNILLYGGVAAVAIIIIAGIAVYILKVRKPT